MGVPTEEPGMTLVEAIRGRRSVRGYLDREVPEDVLASVFDLAGHAPSNCNVQPWKVYVATGATRDRLRDAMLERVDRGIAGTPDYEYRGDFDGEYRRRQVECAVAMYREMGVARDDRPGRARAVRRNFEFFDAPCMVFLGMAPQFGTTVAIDVGMYAQNLMLAMRAFGLHSCPMGTMRQYPDLVRQAFDITDGTKILFGIAFGYEDPDVDANRTRTSRDPWREMVEIRGGER